MHILAHLLLQYHTVQKKPHYHILVCYPGPTTFLQVSKLCSLLNSPIPKRVLSIVGIYRYFTHKDNPEKYQYNEEEIRVANGFDIKEYNALTTSQVIFIMKEIQILIRNKNFYEYSQLMDYLLEQDTIDLYQIASTHTLFFDRYLSSRRNKKKEDLEKLEKLVLHNRK